MPTIAGRAYSHVLPSMGQQAADAIQDALRGGE
jgi:hypothetical protein